MPYRDAGATDATRCQSFTARIELAKTQDLARDIARQWLTPRSLPECTRAFAWLNTEGLLTPELIEKRAALLRVVSQALDPRRPFVRVGGELQHPDLERLALVGAVYGFANRPLGAVTLLGPVRMDYEKALRSVRGAASELSRFVEEIYERN